MHMLLAWKDNILDLPTLNARPMLECDFPRAKQCSPIARTIAGREQSLSGVFHLSNLGPKIWSVVSKVFPVNP